jgi:hypothetical protein
MKTAVIYHSFFHTTEQYAKWIAEDIGADVMTMRKARDLAGYDRLVIMSGTYCGWMPIAGFLRKNWERLQDKEIVAVAVGMVPEEDPASKISYEKIPPEIRNRIKYFKVRGATPGAKKKQREQEVQKSNLDSVISYLKNESA